MPARARLALFSILAATGADAGGHELCSALLDGAAEVLQHAPPVELLATIGGAKVVERLAALALLAEVCGACRACPRGRNAEPIASEPSRTAR